MRCAVRWAVALAAVAVAAGLAGCGGGEDEAAVSVPAAPGAPLTERVLAADELGIAGFTGAGGDVEAREPANLLRRRVRAGSRRARSRCSTRTASRPWRAGASRPARAAA